jgi:hypothetical protein
VPKDKKSVISIVVVPPNDTPAIREVHPSLASLQGVVGGYLEVVQLTDKVDLYCNEEGWDLPFNRTVGTHQIKGTFFLASRDNDGNTLGLDPLDREAMIKRFTA